MSLDLLLLFHQILVCSCFFVLQVELGTQYIVMIKNMYVILVSFNSTNLSFYPHYFRVGGSVPLVYTYCYEFFSQKYGDIFIVTIATFWGIGRLYTSLLAWLVIPRSISFNIGALNVTNWRLFLMLSAFPSLSSVVALLFLPESPGYLFSVSLL